MRKILERFSALTIDTTESTDRRTLDFVRNTLVCEAPEERVRQAALRSLHYDYGYPRWSLLSEEPVGRGTSDRSRADIVVELPRRPKLSVTEVQPQTAPGYSAWLAAFREQEATVPQLTLVDIPDVVELLVDGLQTELTFLGFRKGAVGVFADFSASSDLIGQGYPAIMEMLVIGEALSRSEQVLRSQLGLRSPDSSKFLEFLERIEGFGSPMAPQLVATSAMHGYWVVPLNDFGRGILISLDLSEMPLCDVGGVAGDVSPASQAEPEGRSALVVIECKAPHIGLTEATFEQVRAYADALNAPLCVVTNGLTTATFTRNGAAWSEIDDIPNFADALADEVLLVRTQSGDYWSGLLPDGLPPDDLLQLWIRTHRLNAANSPRDLRLALCRVGDACTIVSERNRTGMDVLRAVGGGPIVSV